MPHQDPLPGKFVSGALFDRHRSSAPRHRDPPQPSHRPLRTPFAYGFFFLAAALFALAIAAKNRSSMPPPHLSSRDRYPASRMSTREIRTMRHASPPVLFLVDGRGVFTHLHLLEEAFTDGGFIVQHGRTLPVIPAGETDVVLWTFQSPFDPRQLDHIHRILRRRNSNSTVVRLNHIPGMSALLSKDRLSFSLAKTGLRIPRTFHSPEELGDPSDLDLVIKRKSHGGVEFVSGWNEAVHGGPQFWKDSILQERVKGMRIDGVTFDIGLYALLLPQSDFSTRVFIHSSPLVRFCVSAAPTCRISRYHPVWSQSSLRADYRASSGNARVTIQNHLNSRGYSGDEIFNEMEAMAVKAVSSVPLHKAPASVNLTGHGETSITQFFEFVRFDFILQNESAEPYLLEVNLSPNLSPADKDFGEDARWRGTILADLVAMLDKKSLRNTGATGFKLFSTTSYVQGEKRQNDIPTFEKQGVPNPEVEPEAEGDMNRSTIWTPALLAILTVVLNVVYLYFKVLREAKEQRKTDKAIFVTVPEAGEAVDPTSIPQKKLSSKVFGPLIAQKVRSGPRGNSLPALSPENFLPPTAIYSESPRHHLRQLIKIAWPTVVSILLAPICIELGTPLVKFLFFGQYYESINEAVAAFLAATALLYGIIFGFTYQACMEKNLATQALVSREFVILRTLSSLADCFDSVKLSPICRIKAIVASEALSLSRIQSALPEAMNAQFLMMQRVWEIVEAAREASTDGINDQVDLVMLASTVNLVSELTVVIGERITCLSRVVNLFQWLFLEFLAFMSFFGVLLIRTSSTGLDKTLCFLTVFTISTFTWVIADLDDPYHGWYRVDFQQGDLFMVETWKEAVRLFEKAQRNPEEFMRDCQLDSRVAKRRPVHLDFDEEVDQTALDTTQDIPDMRESGLMGPGSDGPRPVSQTPVRLRRQQGPSGVRSPQLKIGRSY